MLRTVAKSIETHHTSILNYFGNRGNNAAAESLILKLRPLELRPEAYGYHFFFVQTRNIYA
ncbi:transposase [Niabella agricola]|uniref:transposase n=1 Tax=Niabella agricola TaxID=2891571 RepID=UPI001F31EC8B|nr:transposase [Niabella agricola]